jgi:Ala-tRNA(Pro) deacylase
MEPNTDIHLRLCELLDREHAVYRVLEHAPEGRTEFITKVRGNRLQQAIKSIVVQVRLNRKENQYCLANVPGDCRVDLEGVRAAFAADSVGMASREKAEALAGCVIGSIPPFSFNPDLIVLADPLIEQNEEVVFNAGRLDRSIFMKAADYVRIARPRMAAIASRS